MAPKIQSVCKKVGKSLSDTTKNLVVSNSFTSQNKNYHAFSKWSNFKWSNCRIVETTWNKCLLDHFSETISMPPMVPRVNSEEPHTEKTEDHMKPGCFPGWDTDAKNRMSETLHHRKLTISPKEGPCSKGNFIFQPSVFKGYFSFSGEWRLDEWYSSQYQALDYKIKIATIFIVTRKTLFEAWGPWFKFK